MPQIKPTRGICLNRSHPLSRGLVGFWLFNEGSGTKVFDLSGNRNTGTFVGDTAWTPGKFGSCLNFDGINDYVSLIDNSLNLAGDVTICALIKRSSSPNTTFVVGRVEGNPWHHNWAMQIDGGKLRLNFWNGSTWVGAKEDSVSMSENVWYFVSVVNNNGTCTLYVNGSPVKQTTGQGVLVQDTGQIPAIGGDVAENLYYFRGFIDNVMVFNRALSASEIAQLYREPFCMFERAWIPRLIGGQIVELIGTSAALSSLSATTKATRKVGGNVAGTSDVTALLNFIRSLLNIERNWLREALFNGMTANAYKLGTTLSLGWFWVRVAGCSVLYRGSDMDEIDFVNILAVAEQDVCEISPSSYISHNSGSTYFYVVRRFNNCGYQECTLAASVKVSIESNGELAEPQPNKVFDSGAELIDGNKIRLVWYYCPLEQKSQPMCFNVYYDGRTGQIDYENPLATIEYQGRKFYSYQSSTLEAGKYLFAIRAKDAGGIENSSLARLRIQLDTTSPNAIDILSAEAV